jgi:hypothetical protein
VTFTLNTSAGVSAQDFPVGTVLALGGGFFLAENVTVTSSTDLATGSVQIKATRPAFGRRTHSVGRLMGSLGLQLAGGRR